MVGASSSQERDAHYQREFLFTPADFESLRVMIKEQTGINLTAAKEDMVYARLAKRLRATGLTSFGQYLKRVEQDHAERCLLTNAITTNLTSFFRESHHFDHLQRVVIPELVRRKGRERRLRIWSAGCSSGEEPYSLAMSVLEAIPDPAQWDIKILASDLDTGMVDKAERGVYPLERLNGVSQARRSRWMQRGSGDHDGSARMRNDLRSVIRFRQLNLMDEWPMQCNFDVIFCRNVVIYFDKATQQRLFARYAEQLEPQGWLYIGHSESLLGVADRFRLAGKTIYQRVD